MLAASNDAEAGQALPRIAVIGPEKTGTHLSVRLLNRLGLRNSGHSPSRFVASGPDDCFGVDPAEFQKDPDRVHIWAWPTSGLPRSLLFDWLGQVGRGEYSHSHAPHSPELEQIFVDLGYRIILTLRDPRDQALSMANWYADDGSPDNHRRRELGPLPAERRLEIAIAGSRLSNGAGILGVREHFESVAGWRRSPIVETVRFEDLVGPDGGGSAEAQLRAVATLSNHVGVPLSKNRLQKISARLFGGTHTFRSGTIGKWRQRFTPDTVALFKEHANDLLIELGYETSDDWGIA